jgi:hypothetical protein
VYFAPFQKVFRTVALTMNEVIYIVLLTSSILILDTIRKKLMPSVFTEIPQREIGKVSMKEMDGKRKPEVKEDRLGVFALILISVNSLTRPY